jgi:hypothetical protein
MTYRARTNSARVASFVDGLAETSDGDESPQFHTSNTHLGDPVSENPVYQALSCPGRGLLTVWPLIRSCDRATGFALVPANAAYLSVYFPLNGRIG